MQHLIHDISEADFDVNQGGQVEIIGWLYQYYNTEPKDVAISQPKSHKFRNIEIASATQIFTPDWIVKYMVQNSLGKLWIQHLLLRNDSLTEKQLAEQFQWQYYMEDGPQSEEGHNQVLESEKSLKNLRVQDIKFIDPAMGSGHILVYAFEVLMDIYLSEGFSKREAAEQIMNNNVHGLDIDTRAFQLSYFAVMMKARQYNRRILSTEHSLNVLCIPDTQDLNLENFDPLFERLTEGSSAMLKKLIVDFQHGDEFGSLITEERIDFSALTSELDQLNQNQLSFVLIPLIEKANAIIEVAKVLSQSYHVVIANPPYMGSSRMSSVLAKFAKKEYPNSKSDLFSMFIERWNNAILPGGYNCMVTMQSWMFLSSFEKMRKNILAKYTISNLMHMENNVMGIAFGTAVTIFRNAAMPDFKGTYHQIKTADVAKQAPVSLPIPGNRFNRTNQANFGKIPGSPIAYWVKKSTYQSYEQNPTLMDVYHPEVGMTTSNNKLFVRKWFEVSMTECNMFDGKENKWFPYAKGGGYRKWFGLENEIVNWAHNGQSIKNYRKYGAQKTAAVRNENDYFKIGITWSAVTSGRFSARLLPANHIFDSGGSSIFPSSEDRIMILGIMNSIIMDENLLIKNPTLNFQPSDIGSLPVISQKDGRAENVVKQNINIARIDWDTFENSWNFELHPLLLHIADDKQKKIDGRLENAFAVWKDEAQERFEKLKANEEELNRIFIDLYGLNDELTPEVADKDVSVRRADEERDIKSLLSYFVGLVFGRYSLDVPGLAYAGGDWSNDKYQSFVPNKDNLLLLNDDRYFDDERDIMNRFKSFLAITFGDKHIQENMDYIARIIGKKVDNSEQAIRKYFVDDFFKDHKKGYQNRPIYWEFSSGEQAGFKALMYLHRYDEGELAMIRTDYLYPLQSRYEEYIERLEQWVQDESVAKTKKQLEKNLKHVTQQLKELKQYDSILRHVADERIKLDLDDGVLVNYDKLQDESRILTKL
ncbi:BREX-1 system adenine-specific DNA-methyltransferase PglX [Lactiplantibacillus pentosus]|uniref:site-specific DNA-methyltransferase (adenine-specific) n=1 Tax=Lactiplantibacillus pentosus TaxID=1589 RepID=A0ABD7ILH6_LACPE|nr:BREX-1 system adenine-specific DNA-methyltransferase PglX [Lactiplantibacillus pentosus]RMW43347.1 BREX-1 system adenine-specific DNA-methyltransferase PglX [Lactiplantibacillus pentosus]